MDHTYEMIDIYLAFSLSFSNANGVLDHDQLHINEMGLSSFPF